MAMKPTPGPQSLSLPSSSRESKRSHRVNTRKDEEDKEINMEQSHAPCDMQTLLDFDFPLTLTEKGSSSPVLSVQSSRKQKESVITPL
jgi:hypothetical protein